MFVIRELQSRRSDILQLAHKHGIIDLKVFGSVVRQEENPDSDIDFLATFEENRSLFDLIRFKDDLEQMLQRRIDVITKDSVHWSIKHKIINEAIEL